MLSLVVNRMINFNEPIDRMGTYSTQWDFMADRFGASNILPFSISDMDLAIPNELVTIMKKRLEHPILGYSRWNHPEYLEAITHWYRQRFEVEIEPEWLSYSPSVMYSLSKCIELLSQEQDEILLFTPAYNAFFDCITMNRRKVLCSNLILENQQYTIDWSDFEEKCRQAKIILLCNPHNPVGRVWQEWELIKIIEIGKKNNCYIISDDIHMDIILEGTFYPLLKAKNYQHNIILLSSISKSFNVPALTGSYVIIPNEQLRKSFQVITRYRDFVNSPAVLNVLATIKAYQIGNEWLSELLDHIKRNLEIVTHFLKANIPEIKLIKPEGCYFAWLDCSELKISSEKLQTLLITIGKVGIMSGRTYGQTGENFLRLNIACSDIKLIDGLNRLKITVEYIKAQKKRGENHG